MVKWSSKTVIFVIRRLTSVSEVVFENCDLRDQALDQRLVKLRDGGGLLPDEILKHESLQPT